MSSPVTIAMRALAPVRIIIVNCPAELVKPLQAGFHLLRLLHLRFQEVPVPQAAMRANPATLITESSGISECLDRLAAHKHTARPLSTYRLQFNAHFRFEDARRLAGYLHALGVSHVYASPILQARAGSLHCYDITDHNSLNPEIGTYEEFQSFVRELKNYGRGQILDFVPNHMGVGTNSWWRDVLANGRSSEFAEFFDIDWNPLKPELHNKLLLPILGDQYGAELEAGHISLVPGEKSFEIK